MVINLPILEAEPDTSNIFHSPVSPKLPSPWGQVKILDLGLARLDEDPNAPSQREALTKFGTVMGTPDFMSPEQALHSTNADIRSDIYSLGCTLYFMLLGRPPFPGGDAVEKMLKHQLDEPAPVQSVRQDIPKAIAVVLDKMMAKDAKKRYQTPQEVVAALKPLIKYPAAKAIPMLAAKSDSMSDTASFAKMQTSTDAAGPEAIASPHIAAEPESDHFPVVSQSLFQTPSRRTDWGFWVFLALVFTGAVVCLVIALLIVLR